MVAVFDPDDRVRYLDAPRIWQFLVEGDFRNAGVADKQAHGLAKDNIAFMLERALAERLVTHREVVEGISVAEIAKRLPKAELGKIIEGALTKSKSNSPFSEADLLRGAFRAAGGGMGMTSDTGFGVRSRSAACTSWVTVSSPSPSS